MDRLQRGSGRDVRSPCGDANDGLAVEIEAGRLARVGQGAKRDRDIRHFKLGERRQQQSRRLKSAESQAVRWARVAAFLSLAVGLTGCVSETLEFGPFERAD